MSLKNVKKLLLIFLFIATTGCEDAGIDDLFGAGSGIGNSALSFSPAIHDFGNIAPSPASSDQTFNVSNTSDEVLSISSTVGANANFTILTSTCSGVVAPAGSCSIDVRFSPTSGGNHSTTLAINYSVLGEEQTLISTANLSGSSNADAPSNYTLDNVTGTTMQFSWTDNSSNESGFEVERCDGAACTTTFTAAATATLAADTTSHTFTGLTDGQFYLVRVRATSPGANSDWLTGVQTITFAGISSTDNGALTSTFTSQIDCDSHNGVYVGLQWSSIASASIYNVWDVTSGTPSLLGTTASTSFAVQNLTAGVSKTYRVTATTSGGLVSKNDTADTTLTTSGTAPCVSYPHTALNTFDDMPKLLHTPYGVWSDGTSRLIVADRSNHRVLIWNSIPASNYAAADIVLGQPDMFTTVANGGGRSAQTLNSPEGVFFDGTKLYVADRGNHRVLIWNSIPTSNQQAADVVVGQESFTAASGQRNQDSFNQPTNVFVDGTKLLVTDYNNNRVMVFNSIPTTNGVDADLVIGNSSFTNNQTGCNSSQLRNPRGVWASGNKLIITSYTQNRALVWTTFPGSNGAAADFAIGQDNLTSCSKNKNNNNTPKVDGLRSPWGVTSDGDNVWIADYTNERVVYYPGFFTAPANSFDATGVYGPNTLSAIQAGSTSTRLDNPTTIIRTPNNQLWVADATNSRIVQKATAPTGIGETHDLYVGKSGPNLSGANRIQPSNLALFNAGQTATDGTRFAVADTSNHRVLIWNNMPASNAQTPDVVLGQPDFNSFTRDNGASGSGQRLDTPYGVGFHGGRFFVADTSNHRILVWNSIPTSNHQAADYVIGQTALNQYGHSSAQHRLRVPTSIHFSSDNKLIVADRDNNRVMIWNAVPTASGVNADVVVGQTGFGTNGAAKAQNRLDAPWTATTMGSALLVSERDNNRVMIWNTIPTSHGALANVVLGQPDFTSNTADNGGTSQQSLDQPFGMVAAGGKLYISDYDNARILIWNSLPTTTRQAADAVFGQNNFSAVTVNKGQKLNKGVLGQPRHLSTDPSGTRLFISDTFNRRIMVIPAP